MTDPSGCLFILIVWICGDTKLQLERIQVRNGNIIRYKQMVGEVREVMPFLFFIAVRACGLELLLVNVEAWHRAPEVPPSGGQHAGLHHLPGLQEGDDVVDEAIR